MATSVERLVNSLKFCTDFIKFSDIYPTHSTQNYIASTTTALQNFSLQSLLIIKIRSLYKSDCNNTFCTSHTFGVSRRRSYICLQFMGDMISVFAHLSTLCILSYRARAIKTKSVQKNACASGLQTMSTY